MNSPILLSEGFKVLNSCTSHAGRKLKLTFVLGTERAGAITLPPWQAGLAAYLPERVAV